jgi:hypothetical protein
VLLSQTVINHWNDTPKHEIPQGHLVLLFLHQHKGATTLTHCQHRANGYMPITRFLPSLRNPLAFMLGELQQGVLSPSRIAQSRPISPSHSLKDIRLSISTFFVDNRDDSSSYDSNTNQGYSLASLVLATSLSRVYPFGFVSPSFWLASLLSYCIFFLSFLNLGFILFQRCSRNSLLQLSNIVFPSYYFIMMIS